MITVTLNDRSYEYDIYSLIKAFFPNKEIRVMDFGQEEEAISEKISLSLEIKLTPGWISVTWSRPALKRGESGNSDEFPLAGEYREDLQNDAEKRREMKNHVKKMLYTMLRELTGRELPWGTLTGIRPVKIPLGMLEDGKDEDAIAGYMKDTYMASDEKIALSTAIAKRELSLLKQLDYQDGYSLYIGIPFCPSRCLYCSFTGYPEKQWKTRMDEYLDALEQELFFVQQCLSHKKCNTIYIGGGTPTTLSAGQLDRLLTMVEKKISMGSVLEFTVEAGRPDSITEEKLRVIRTHAVDRISVNPQTMNQKTLDIIGRQHTVEQTVESFEMARRIGFKNINMDLIMGLPGETLADVDHTLAEIAKLSPDNMTVHSLAIKRAARLNAEREFFLGYPMENSQAHIDLASECAKEMGMFPYYLYRQKNMAGNLENIGFAKEGAEGIYNILIMEERQTIIALGAGAACKYVSPDRKTVIRSENVKDVALYMKRLPEMIERKRMKLEEMGWL